MRNLARNLDVVFYKLYEGEEEIIDQFGNGTGSYFKKYGELKKTRLCISPNKGSSEVNMFGSFADYDRTMTTSDTKCPIDENSVLWIDGVDTDGPWNYQVKLRAPWKNSISFAIKRVDVSIAKAEMEQNEVQARMKVVSVLNADLQTQNAVDSQEGAC